MNHMSPARLVTAAIYAAPILWTIVFLIVPYLIIFTYSFYTRQFPLFVPDLQFGNYATIFSDQQYYQVLVRTFRISAIVSVVSLLLAYPFCYFLVFKLKSPTLRLCLYFAVIVPLWTSYLLRAYVWRTILGSEGVLNSFLLSIGLIETPISAFLYNQTAMIITLTYIYIPFCVMPIYAALERIPRNITEASKDLGAGRVETFLRITLPLSMVGVLAGMTLTFCLTFGDFVAPMLVGGPDGTMVANVIQTLFGSALNYPLGSAFAIIILVVVLSVITLSERLQRSDRMGLG
ncbi:MAG: ABC transporter permease [Pseudomonadota bacterium]